ncbi:MAG: anaerobic ribonucleoside-triphosphate reductase activating protein [Clostridium sp.]
MNYANIKNCDVANGEGIRVSLFVSGCTHYCKGCFNYEAWDFNFGKEYTKETEDHIIKLLSSSYIKGLSLLGGEPLHPDNQKQVASLVKRVRKELPQKDIWCYTGYVFDKEILDGMYKELSTTKDIIDNIDVLVDGKFVIDLADKRLRFRGSSNQRIIDVKKSLKNNDIELWDMNYGI